MSLAAARSAIYVMTIYDTHQCGGSTKSLATCKRVARNDPCNGLPALIRLFFPNPSVNKFLP